MSILNITVVVPVFNEEAVIALFHEKTRAVLDALEGVHAEILFVVDRGTDNTLPILRDIVARDKKARVLALSSRFGHQMAILAGIEHSTKADAIVMMDADLQHPPELIPQLIAAYQKGAMIVHTIRASTEGGSFARRWFGDLFYRLLAWLSHIPINPNAADFRLIDRRVADALMTHFKERNLFLRGLFSWMGFEQTCVEYVAGVRAAGESKYSLRKTFQLALNGILSFSIRPLHVGIFIGVGLASIAFLLILIAVINYFIERTIPSGWTTSIVLLLLFSGIQLIVLGILGAYIGGIYEEVKGRPRYLVDEEIVNAE